MTAPAHARGTPLYDNAALRTLEAVEHARLGDASALMERAGQAAWRALLARWPDARRIAVVCGPGNNGGDGYVLARLALASGCDVRVLRAPEHAPRAAAATDACARYVQAGGRVDADDAGLADRDLVVDALFGIGLSRAPDAAAAASIAAINRSGRPVFALDAPSGIDTDTGIAPGAAVRATQTLQFLGAHVGLCTGVAPDHTGTLSLATLDVGSPVAPLQPAAIRLQADDLAGWIAPRARDAHKGQGGHVLCVGGDLGKGGAVLLAAEAALRCGAGLVSVATREAHVAALLARRPEAMAHALADAGGLDPLLARADVVALGPGLGQDGWGVALHDATLSGQVPLVLDADALNLLAQRTRPLPAGTILTPHPGEAARLLGISAAEVQANRFATARLLCEMSGCVVVLKGAGTLVVAPGEIPRVIAAGNPGMAVGGMGDLLTGCIAALRAQGFASFEAACCGALLHAAAGDAAAAEGGERGLLPSDLLPWLRRGANAGARA